MPPRDVPEWSGSGTDPQEYEEEDLEALIERAEQPFAVDSFGTTAEEQVRGPSLDRRLVEEHDDALDREVELAIEDVDAPDHEAEMIGDAVWEREPFVAPEEAAMTVRDHAPGGVDHADDEYVELYDEFKNEG